MTWALQMGSDTRIQFLHQTVEMSIKFKGIAIGALEPFLGPRFDNPLCRRTLQSHYQGGYVWPEHPVACTQPTHVRKWAFVITQNFAIQRPGHVCCTARWAVGIGSISL